MIIEKVSKRLTDMIKNNLSNIDDRQYDVINYGIYVIISDVLKMILMLLTAYFLGILDFTLVSLLSFGIFRSFTGGVHAKTWLGCFITNSLLFFSIVYLSFYISNINVIYISIITFPVSFIIVLLYAPSDHINKPIVSQKQRKGLKSLSFVSLFLIHIIAIFAVKQPFSNIIIISSFAECITILPLTYKLTGNLYGSTPNMSHSTGVEQ